MSRPRGSTATAGGPPGIARKVLPFRIPCRHKLAEDVCGFESCPDCGEVRPEGGTWTPVS